MHAGIECYYSGAAHTTVLCGGYGPNAGAITGAQTSTDYVSTLPLQGNTRTLELFCNKATGRVTLALDSQILVDYFDIRTISYTFTLILGNMFNPRPKHLPKISSFSLRINSLRNEGRLTNFNLFIYRS